jgi:hypothetical protein
MSSSFNNFCESLVNGTNPRYIGSQPTINQQVSWQIKQQQETSAACFASIKRDIDWKVNNGYYVSQLDMNSVKFAPINK